MAEILIILLVGFWIAALVFFRAFRIWLLFYFVGSVGLALLLIFGGRIFYLETWLEGVVALTVHWGADLIGIPTRIFAAAPGALLVLVVTQPVGWTVVQITIECSALMEMAVMVGMITFYPAWTMQKKLLLTALGIVGTFIANAIRILVIIWILHSTGKDSLYVAHTIVGRAVFFLMIVVMYWYILTVPTLQTIRAKLQREMAQ